MRNTLLRQVYFSTFCSFILLSLSCTATASSPNKEALSKAEKTTQNQKEELYLFVQGAHEAKLSKNPRNQNEYLLELKNVNPYLTIFTERPTRKLKSLSLKKYLDMWNSNKTNNFRQNPPNAAFHAIQKNASHDAEALNYILELNTPKYDAATKTLTYSVKPLKGNTETLPETATTLHHAILFIDDACLSCW